MYTRKTKDVYEIQGNYGYGWDLEVYCDDYSDAKKQLKTYRENVRNASFKIVCRRVKIQ